MSVRARKKKVLGFNNIFMYDIYCAKKYNFFDYILIVKMMKQLKIHPKIYKKGEKKNFT